jgi:hypothetical protein
MIIDYCAQCNTNITAVFYFSCVERRFGGGKTEDERMSRVRKNDVVVKYMGTMAR